MLKYLIPVEFFKNLKKLNSYLKLSEKKNDISEWSWSIEISTSMIYFGFITWLYTGRKRVANRSFASSLR